MNLKLKIVVRSGLVETNSSSSHSVVIQTRGPLCKAGDKYWDLDIRDNILYIPKCDGFGWEEFKSNSCLTKLQYVCGLMCDDGLTAEGHKRIYKLTMILKSFLGVDDVKYEWIEELKGKNVDDDDFYYDCIEIDHNSRELINEIFENEYTLRNFIFNPDSWLYGGNDNSTRSKGFRSETYLETDNPDCYFSVETDNVGRVDIPINHIDKGFRSSFFYYSDDNVHNNLVWLKNENKIIIYIPNNQVLSGQDAVLISRNIESLNNISPIVIIDNVSYLLFGPSREIVNTKLNSTTINDQEKEIIELIKSGKLVKDVDYKLVKVDIKFADLE